MSRREELKRDLLDGIPIGLVAKKYKLSARDVKQIAESCRADKEMAKIIKDIAATTINDSALSRATTINEPSPQSQATQAPPHSGPPIS